MDNCILCQAKSPIKGSHVVPKFVIRRLKEGTPVKSLRDSNRIRKAVQDGWKGALLCADCEQKVSGWENYFCTSLYDPFINEEVDTVDYDHRLYLFLTSIHLRFIEYLRHQNRSVSIAQVEELIKDLRLICSSNGSASNKVYQYITFLHPVTSIDQYPPGVNTYFFEAIDGFVFPYIIPKIETFCVSYVKIPHCIMVSANNDLAMAEAKDKSLITDYRIQMSGKVNLSCPSSPVLLGLFADRIIAKSSEIQNNYFRIPLKQLKKTFNQIISDPNTLNTRAHKSYLLDMQLLKQWLKT